MIGRSSRSAALFAAAAGLFLVTALPVMAASPAIRVDHIGGPLATDYYNPTDELALGPGTYWLTSTAEVDATQSALAVVQVGCQLVTDVNGTRTVIDDATWTLAGGTSSGASEASEYLTGVAQLPQGGMAELSCTSRPTDSATIDDPTLSAVAGTVTGTTPTIRQFVSNPPTSLTIGSTFGSVGSLRLGGGAWWVVAKTNLRNGTSTSSTSCKIAMSSTDVDESVQTLAGTGNTGYRGEIGLQVAHAASAATATLQCRADQPTTATYTRIIAIRAGSLKLWRVGSSPATAGSGTPRVISRFQYPTASIPVTDAVIASLALPPGQWLIQAKAWLQEGTSSIAVTCTFDFTGNFALGNGPAEQPESSRGGYPAGSTGLYLQAADGVNNGGATVQLHCHAASSGASLRFIRLTAISANPLYVQVGG